MQPGGHEPRQRYLEAHGSNRPDASVGQFVREPIGLRRYYPRNGLELPMKALLLASVLGLGACGHAAVAPARDSTISSTDGTSARFQEYLARAPFTVLVFVSADCPCLTAHDERLRELFAVYAPRGIQFFAIESEVGTTVDSARGEARERGYPFPILVDRGAVLANRFGAEFAAYSVIVDRTGNIHYRGGIDSDRRKLHPNADSYVRDALEDLLAGRTPRLAEARALGCVLRKW